MATLSPTSVAICYYCNKHFYDSIQYINHRYNCNEKQHRPLIRCPICPASFRHIHWLDEHVEFFHNISPQTKSDVRNYLPKNFNCRCGKTFTTLLIFNHHTALCDYREPSSNNHNKWYHHCNMI